MVELSTFVSIDSSRTSSAFLGIGEDVPGALRVELFGESNTMGASVDKLDCLAALCREGFVRVLGRGLIIRPAVTVIGAGSLESVLHGYQAPLIRQALLDAGGRDIQIALSEVA